MKAIICDIDGVIANTDHRIHHLDGIKDYLSFYDEMSSDAPILSTIQLLKVLKEAYVVILITARPDSHRLLTEAWLEEHNVPYDYLYMRKAGDFRPDVIVKEEIYFAQVNHEIVAVFEDRTRVVEMWRKLGLPCWQNVFWKED